MRLKAGFMGSPEFAVPCLRVVAERCDLQVVVCQPDRPAGRGRKLTAPAVKEAARDLGVPIEQPVKMRDGTLARALARYDLDLVVVVAFGRILPREILVLPKHGCINVHGSILPRWRGAAPIQRAVLAGDTETGVSIMAMDEGLDTGPVHCIAETPIGPYETSGELFLRLAELGARTLDTVLAGFPPPSPPVAQDHGLATHAPPLAKEEGQTMWDRPVRAIVDHVRGMDPWPVATASRGDDRLKLFAARPSSWAPTSAPAGTVLGVDEDGLHVQVQDGVVHIRELQPPGKRRMPAAAYAAGKPFAPGEVLGA